MRVTAALLILLTNDDGIYAPGLAALEHALARLGDVVVVAPATEQSGVGHSITYLRPLIVKEVFEGQRRRGWAVEGSPADCVKLGIFECCPRRPDLVVSGVNSGLNAGINVLYSGTVAAAIEGAFFGITSFAVSLEFDEHANYERAAELATDLIRQTVDSADREPRLNGTRLFNVNLPREALVDERPRARFAAMSTTRYDDQYEKRIDPRGRSYFWASADQRPQAAGESDEALLDQGFITVTPLGFDLTRHELLPRLRDWEFSLPPPGAGP